MTELAEALVSLQRGSSFSGSDNSLDTLDQQPGTKLSGGELDEASAPSTLAVTRDAIGMCHQMTKREQQLKKSSRNGPLPRHGLEV
jgi:hypothetical protein